MFRAPPSLYASDLFPRVLAPTGELLLDALDVLSMPPRSVLEYAAGIGGLSSALVKLPKLRSASVVSIDSDPALAAHLPAAHGVCASSGRLPFRDAQFDVVLGNGVLGDRGEDMTRFSELERVLRPGGACMLTGFLSGSFDELFDVLGDVAESVRLHHVKGALIDGRAGLWQQSGLHRALGEMGLDVVTLHERERAIALGPGTTMAHDPLIRGVLAPRWLGHKGGLGADVWELVDETLRTTFSGLPATLTVREVVVHARAARSD